MKLISLATTSLVASVVLAAPASAATSSVAVDLPDAQLASECSGIPVVLSVSGASPEIRYEAAITLHDPQGVRDTPVQEDLYTVPNQPTTVSGSVRSGGATSTKTVQMDACGYEGAGRWRVDVKIDYYDAADNVVETKSAQDTATFTQAPTHTTIERNRSNRALNIRVTVDDPSGTGPCQACYTRLQRSSGGKWKTVAKDFTNDHGVFRTGVKPRKRATYRAVTTDQSVAQSESQPFSRKAGIR